MDNEYDDNVQDDHCVFETNDEDESNVDDKDGSMGRFEGVRARRKWRKRGRRAKF